MTVRPFDWRDLPVLHRYRNQCLYLDTAKLLTRGQVLMPMGALLSYFAPATGIFTYISTNDEIPYHPILGQMAHPAGHTSAQLSFFAPENALETANVLELLERAAVELGERGAMHILAEVDEHHPIFSTLHKAGFAIYVRQRIWQLAGETTAEKTHSLWRPCTERDIAGVRFLYSSLVPGLVQQVEPPLPSQPQGLVYYDHGDLRAYIELKYGLKGILAHPFIHPDIENDVPNLLTHLQNLANRHTRPIYLYVRSYQSWLEPLVEALDAQPGPRQAVMVKHFTRRITQPFALPAIENKRAEPTAPMARMESKLGSQPKNKALR